MQSTSYKKSSVMPTASELRLMREPLISFKQQKSPLHFTENSDVHDTYLYGIKNIVCSQQTKFQQVLIADTISFGRVLVLDGHIQSAKSDETLYHEMLVQPAMLFHPDPKRVLIIGGGEGASLREVLVHRSVELATMVDIDGELVDLCKEHLGEWHRGAFNDPRTNLNIDDGRKYVLECVKRNEKYDVIIIDIVDMLENNPARLLYTQEYYEYLKKCLTANGLLVFQAMEFSLPYSGHQALSRTLRTVFSQVHTYSTSIPSFLAPWSFTIASNHFIPDSFTPAKINEEIELKIPGWLKHLHGEFLKSVFVHSKLNNFLLSMPGPILLDKDSHQPEAGYEEIIDQNMKFPLNFSNLETR